MELFLAGVNYSTGTHKHNSFFKEICDYSAAGRSLWSLAAHPASNCLQTPFGHAAAPWTSWAIWAEIETAAGDTAAAQATKQQATALYLTYRSVGGENHRGSGRFSPHYYKPCWKTMPAPRPYRFIPNIAAPSASAPGGASRWAPTLTPPARPPFPGYACAGAGWP